MLSILDEAMHNAWIVDSIIHWRMLFSCIVEKTGGVVCNVNFPTKARSGERSLERPVGMSDEKNLILLASMTPLILFLERKRNWHSLPHSMA